MADNVDITPGSGAKAAAREVPYSGDAAKLQIVGLATVSGPDDATTARDVSLDNPLPVRLDGGPGAVLAANNSLQVDATQSNEHSAEALNAPNAALVGDEPVQMVGLHPSYPLPIDTATPMPVAGRNPDGADTRLAVDYDGKLVPADSVAFLSLSSPTNHPASFGGPTIRFECTGYQSLVLSFTNGSSSAPFQIQQSQDGVTWFSAFGYDLTSQSTVLLTTIISTSNTYLIQLWGRFIRLNYENTTAPGYRLFVNVWLRRRDFPFAIRNTAVNSVNLSSISGAAITLGAAQFAVNAFGPTVPNAAHGISAPVQMSGSDGTNVRRILTDTTGNTRVVGPVAAGTSMISPTNAAFAPDLLGLADLEGRVQRVTGDVRGRVQVKTEDATAADDGIIDALNNVVRELKLLNAKITDLPIYLGLGAAMPDDDKAFRDDPTIFNS